MGVIIARHETQASRTDVKHDAVCGTGMGVVQKALGLLRLARRKPAGEFQRPLEIRRRGFLRKAISHLGGSSMEHLAAQLDLQVGNRAQEPVSAVGINANGVRQRRVEGEQRRPGNNREERKNGNEQ